MANGEFEPEFGRLLDAILLENAETLVAIVEDAPEVLEATNRAGENVLRWCALENRYDDVRLLRSLGSEIQEAALWEAIEMGHTDMLVLLLELGGNTTASQARASIRLGVEFGSLSRRKAHIVRSHLNAYGVEV